MITLRVKIITGTVMYTPFSLQKGRWCSAGIKESTCIIYEEEHMHNMRVNICATTAYGAVILFYDNKHLAKRLPFNVNATALQGCVDAASWCFLQGKVYIC